MAKITREEALEYHHLKGKPGKIAVVPTKPMDTQRDLSLAYTPGVAVPVLEIEKDADGGQVGHIADLYSVLDATEPGGRGLVDGEDRSLDRKSQALRQKSPSFHPIRPPACADNDIASTGISLRAWRDRPSVNRDCAHPSRDRCRKRWPRNAICT